MSVPAKYEKMRTLLLLLASYFCLSCTKSTVCESVTSFPRTTDLEAEILPIPVPVLLPRYIGIMDDYLYIYKEKEEKLFAFFDLKDGSYITDEGSRGQGPDEFILLDARGFGRMDGNRFTAFEAGSNSLKTVHFDGRKLSVQETKPIFKQGVTSNGFYSLADSMYLTLGRLEGTSEYCLLDGKTGDLSEIGEYPSWVKQEDAVNNPPLFVPYLKTCAVHPDKKKVVAFYTRFKHVRIYDDAMNLLHDVDVQVPPCSFDFQKPVSKQPVYYIGAPCVTEEYIYVLCANSHTDAGQSELQVWNWKGKPVACFRLDRNLSMMVLDERNHKIYAVDNRVENELYVYQLPSI